MYLKKDFLGSGLQPTAARPCFSRVEQESFKLAVGNRRVNVAHQDRSRQFLGRKRVRIAVLDSLQPTAARPCVSRVGQESFKRATGNRFARVVRQERRILWWANLVALYVFQDAIQRRRLRDAYCVDRECRATLETPIAPHVH